MVLNLDGSVPVACLQLGSERQSYGMSIILNGRIRKPKGTH